jgi:hypothetical protein
MIGNYTYQPRHNQALELSDIEEFVLALLKDICSESASVDLNTHTKVNYEGDLNLSDLNDTTKYLLSFMFMAGDTRNTNLKATTNDDGETIKAVYQIGMLAEKSEISSIEFLKNYEEVINGITNNLNGTTTGLPVRYSVVLSNGKTLSTSLIDNQPDPYPQISVAQEDSTQPNYLTALSNVVLTIYNNT